MNILISILVVLVLLLTAIATTHAWRTHKAFEAYQSRVNKILLSLTHLQADQARRHKDLYDLTSLLALKFHDHLNESLTKELM